MPCGLQPQARYASPLPAVIKFYPNLSQVTCCRQMKCIDFEAVFGQVPMCRMSGPAADQALVNHWSFAVGMYWMRLHFCMLQNEAVY